jgi:hypothetical protein
MHTELRCLLASLDYRFVVVTSGAPVDFGQFRAGEGVRTPAEIVRHLSGLLELIQQQFGPVELHPPGNDDFESECLRFRASLRGLDRCLAEGRPFSPTRPGLEFEGLLRGPVSDALTHIGQLAMLRRLAGSPVERVRYWQVEMPAPASRALEP